MATINMGTCGPFPLYSRHRSMCLAYVEGIVHDTNDFVVTSDEGNVLSRDTPPVYVAVGIQRFTLRERWRGFVAIPTLEDPTKQVDVAAITDGSGAANVVDIQCHVATVAGAYTNANNVLKLTLILFR